MIDDINHLRIKSSVQINEKTFRTQSKTTSDNLPTKRLYSDVVQGLSNRTSPIKSHASELTTTSIDGSKTNETIILTPRTVVTEETEPLDLKPVKSSQTTTEWNGNYHHLNTLKSFATTANKSKLNQRLNRDGCATQSYSSATQSYSGATSNYNCATSSYNCATSIYSCATSSYGGATPSYSCATQSNNCPAHNNSCATQSSGCATNSSSCATQSNNYYLSTDCGNYCDYNYNAYTTNFYQHHHQYHPQYSNPYVTTYQTYASVPFAYGTGSFMNNPQQLRQNANQNQFQTNYYLNQYRNLYLTPQPYFILQQPLPKVAQRWQQQTAQQMRPNTPQNYSNSTNQYWNQYTGGNQQLYGGGGGGASGGGYHQVYESNDTRQRNKLKKFVNVTNKVTNRQFGIGINNNSGKVNCTDMVQPPPPQQPPVVSGKSIFIRNNPDESNDFKLIVRNDTSSPVEGTPL